jgi:ATP-dependent DNA helicase RecG
MNKNDFLNLYNLSSWEESEIFEWKLSTRLAKEIVQTMVSFANTRGGVLLCGVSDDGEVVGQDISDATLREIAQTVLANTEERLYPSIERCTIEGKSVLAIHIKEFKIEAVRLATSGDVTISEVSICRS